MYTKLNSKRETKKTNFLHEKVNILTTQRAPKKQKANILVGKIYNSTNIY